MSEQRRTQRGLGYFNAIYGYGMVFVLLTHSLVFYRESLSGNAFYRCISVFGASYMVLFFLLSGYGFHTQPVGKALRFNFRTLLKPYYITAAMVLFTKLILSFVRHRSFWAHGGEYLLTYVLALNLDGGGTLFGIPAESISILWFLWALFEARCLFNCLMRLSSRKLTYALSLACTLIGYCMMEISSVWPFVIHLGLMATGWVALGNLIREEHLLDKTIRPVPLVIMVLLSLITLLRSHTDLLLGELENGVMDVFGITCLGILLLHLSDQIIARISDSAVCRFFGAIGTVNLWIVCVHAYEKVILPHYKVLEWFPDHMVLQVAIIFVVRVAFIAVVCAGLYLGQELLRKFRRRGRKKVTIEL